MVIGKAKRNLRVAAAIFAATIAARTSSALATARTWDLDSAGHNNGVINNGGGTWNTGSTPNWTADGGVTNSNWAANDDASFGGNTSIGAAGTITLSGNQSVTSLTFNAVPSGNFLISGPANRLDLNVAATSITQNSSSAVTVDTTLRAATAANTTMTLGGNGSGAVTISGPFTQSGVTLALTKSGSSNYILTSASNSYTGATNINGGTLTVNGTIAGTGAFNVNSTGKLAGTGTVSKTTTIGNGGTLSPGGDGTNTNVGAINTSTHNWEQNSTYLWEIKDATTAAGTGYDTLNVSGTLTVNATNTAGNKMTIKVVSHGPVTGWNQGLVWNWDISTATTTNGYSADKFVVDASDFVDDNIADANLFSVTQSGTHLRISYIPEPGSGVLAAVGAAALLRRRRQRRP